MNESHTMSMQVSVPDVPTLQQNEVIGDDPNTEKTADSLVMVNSEEVSENVSTVSQESARKTGNFDGKRSLWRAVVDKTQPLIPQKDICNSSGTLDISEAVSNLLNAIRTLHENHANIQSINNLIERLKQYVLQERQNYVFMRQNSDSRKKIESIYNLIQFLEAQVQRLEKMSQSRGLKYYVASISSKIRGSEIERIGQSMETELQSWLDQQTVRKVADVISKGSSEAEQVHTINSFRELVQKGYNAVLQDTILSAGLVEKLAGLLVPVVNNMLSVGQTIVADEIFACDGVSKIVELLDHDSRALQLAVMDCIFELAYCGRVHVVNLLFQLEVIKKLALLQENNATKEDMFASAESDKNKSTEEQESPLGGSSDSFILIQTQEKGSVEEGSFKDAVTKFALHLSIGTGLRKREKRALKQEFLKQIKEVLKDDTEVANITAEVLWAP
ncbi:hypothetical protein KP509_04G013500 [Ceratopteris richardii]|uniref:Uncharacterized protein n=1 Tax=Ceratopteris richardii TaxID=49495 RepID=A0A8T2UQC4_CERRI|nr:hypothetical protein KP509_04G013500 [Ceratopteris richardii]